MKLCFATNNTHKLREIQELLSGRYEIVGLKDIGFFGDIPEEYETLEENSAQKALFITQKYGIDAFADDTGLEAEALNGDPGVYSARYAGVERDNIKNINLLLSNLQNKNNRKAKFRTVITLVMEGKQHQFTGIAEGTIIDKMKGTKGFGYDPVFIPDGYDQTFAEMDLSEKNKLSHRGKAIEKLVQFLNSMP